MKYLKFFVLSLLISLSACTEDKEEIETTESPEVVAVEFFNALYNEKNVKKAAKVCSPQLSRILLSYKSPNAIARHVFNMSYDKVEITPDNSGVKVREQFKDNAVITLYFDGFYHEERMKDVKRLSLIQIDGNWAIDKVLKDPF